MRTTSHFYSIFFTVFFFIFLASHSQEEKLEVNKDRLTVQLKKLSSFGINKGGGNDRVAFSDYDIEARAYLTSYLEALGLQVKVDAAGNLIAKREGKKKFPKSNCFWVPY
jgi:N-carbamoyl-L-amino-acid hydrolase